MNISGFISDHVPKINSQTRNYWQRSVSVYGSTHTDPETRASFHSPEASPGQQLHAERLLCCFHRGPGLLRAWGCSVPRLPAVVSAARTRCLGLTGSQISMGWGWRAPRRKWSRPSLCSASQPSGPSISPGEAAAADHVSPFRGRMGTVLRAEVPLR